MSSPRRKSSLLDDLEDSSALADVEDFDSVEEDCDDAVDFAADDEDDNMVQLGYEIDGQQQVIEPLLDEDASFTAAHKIHKDDNERDNDSQGEEITSRRPLHEDLTSVPIGSADNNDSLDDSRLSSSGNSSRLKRHDNFLTHKSHSASSAFQSLSKSAGDQSVRSASAVGSLLLISRRQTLGTPTRRRHPEDWESILASPASGTVRSMQFHPDDPVLCRLELLNDAIYNSADVNLDAASMDPVNVYGYPAGEGKSTFERNGPYSFVLCTVVNLHFDEDERYYTVRRHDTKTEQRADPQWMELCLGGLAGLEAAEEAAKRTGRDVAGVTEQPQTVQDEVSAWVVDAVVSLIRFVVMVMIPWCIYLWNRIKLFLTRLLTGDKGFGCRIRLTCVNVLVLCSFIYLLIEPFTFAFLPASLDHASATLEL
jgi:hypothetical protein